MNKGGEDIREIVEPLVEVTRSFSYKLGQPNYSSVDFFCSRKEQCPPVDAETTAETSYYFCKAEVLKSLIEYLEGVAQKEKAEREAEDEAIKVKRDVAAKKAEDKEKSKQSAELDAGAKMLTFDETK